MKTYTHKNGMQAREVNGGYQLDQLTNRCGTKQAVVLMTEQELIDFGFIEDKQEVLNTNQKREAYDEFIRLLNGSYDKHIKDHMINQPNWLSDRVEVNNQEGNIGDVGVEAKEIYGLDNKEDWIEKAFRE